MSADRELFERPAPAAFERDAPDGDFVPVA